MIWQAIQIIHTIRGAYQSLSQINRRSQEVRRGLNMNDGASSTDQYRELLEGVLGYTINYGPNAGDNAERMRQLSHLAEADALIVNYFNQIIPDQSNITGLDVFYRRFARVSSEYGESPQSNTNIRAASPITITLGSDEVSSRFVGYTPLTPSDEGFDDIYLGSTMSTASIVHELFHQFDRSFGVGLSSGTNILTNTSVTSLNGNPRAMLARANPDPDAAEVFADFGMTTVIAAAFPQLYYVYPEEAYPIINAQTGSRGATYETTRVGFSENYPQAESELDTYFLNAAFGHPR